MHRQVWWGLARLGFLALRLRAKFFANAASGGQWSVVGDRNFIVLPLYVANFLRLRELIVKLFSRRSGTNITLAHTATLAKKKCFFYFLVLREFGER